jgi:hypothetical protein
MSASSELVWYISVLILRSLRSKRLEGWTGVLSIFEILLKDGLLQ